ncbi:MAG: hypothetical protein AB8B95_10050 [Pseudohongiellaceae bacterium]
MNWEAIGAIGEIIGAIAVVVTLLYLAKETHTNTKAVVASSSRASNLGHAELDERLASNPYLARIVVETSQPTMPDFDEKEWMSFLFLARSLVGRFQDDFLQDKLGFQDSDLADVHLHYLRSMLEFPAWSKYWEDDKSLWIPEFVKDVESRDPSRLSSLDGIDKKKAKETKLKG